MEGFKNYYLERKPFRTMIHLIVGNTGSGKSAYSNNLKIDTLGVVFSLDQWNKTLFFPDKKEEDGLQWMLERIERVETIILEMVLQLDITGTDSILDLGLSKYEQREKFRKFAEVNYIPVKTHFLDISKETRRERVLKRNIEQGETFDLEVTEENFEFMEEWFEEPTPSELEDGIIIKDSINLNN